MSNISPVGGGASPMPSTPLPDNPRLKALKKATQDFEAIWLSQIMREARPKGGMLDKSFAAQTFQDMMSQALGQSMADSGKLGLAKKLYDQLLPRVTAAAGGSEQGSGNGDGKQIVSQKDGDITPSPLPDLQSLIPEWRE